MWKRGESPGTIETRTIGMTSTQSMSTTQSHDLLIIESHSIENISQMLVSLRRIRESSIGCAGCDVFVESAGSVWDGWTLHFLDCADASEDPKVGIGDPWELLCGKRCSKKSLAATRPAFAPWSPSGANLIVAPFDPPVLVSLSKVPDACHANRTRTGYWQISTAL